MSLAFKLGPTESSAFDIAQWVKRDGSLNWQKSVNQGSWTASLVIQDKDGTFLSTMVSHGLGDSTGRPIIGQPIWIKETIGITATIRFGGFFSQIIESEAGGNTGIHEWQCTITGWGGLCDRRVITTEYPTGTEGQDVVFDIVAAQLASDGITATHANNPILAILPSPLTFNPATVADAFNQIRTITGYQWWIDEQKNLHFMLVGSGPNSGITISDSSQMYRAGTMKVTTASDLFRNEQYEKTSQPVGTQSKVETFVGTGDLSTGWWFLTKFGIESAPIVKVDGVSQTIYQINVDAYGQNGWYWMQGAPGVQQGQQIPPAAGSVIEVTYDGLSVSYVVDDDTASQTARAAIEGGSGVWANIDQSATLETADVAHAYGKGQLANFKTVPVVLQFDTDVEAFDTQIGAYVTLSLALHNISGQFTITDVSAVEIPGFTAPSPAAGGTMRYTVKLTNQAAIGNNVTFMQNLVAQIRNSGNGNAAATGTTAPALQAGVQVVSEVPTGTIDGVNRVFTLKYSPTPPAALWLFLDGEAQDPFSGGSPVVGPDYTLSGNTITYRVAPGSTSKHFVIYFIGLQSRAPSSAVGVLKSTGFVGSALGSAGQTDSNWTLQSSPDGSHPGPAAIIISPTAATWVTVSDAKWIGADQAGDAVAGTYTYQLLFDLTGYDPTTMLVKANVASDNDAVVKLNGSTVATISGSDEFTALHAITMSSGFIAGVNTLQVVVTEDGVGPTGILFEITFAGAAPSPTVTGMEIEEFPTGSIDGANTTFTLSRSPNPGASLQLYLNGELQLQGTDYTLSGATITMTSAPSSGAWMVAWYRFSSPSSAVNTYEVPAGTVDGVNAAFTLSRIPDAGTAPKVFLDGVLQLLARDVTLVGLTLTFSTPPHAGSQPAQLAVLYAGGASAVSNFADNETPSGSIDGSNVTFTLAHTPNPANLLMLFLNGIEQLQGTDYTLSSGTITFTNAPSGGAWLRAFYQY